MSTIQCDYCRVRFVNGTYFNAHKCMAMPHNLTDREAAIFKIWEIVAQRKAIQATIRSLQRDIAALDRQHAAVLDESRVVMIGDAKK